MTARNPRSTERYPKFGQLQNYKQENWIFARRMPNALYRRGNGRDSAMEETLYLFLCANQKTKTIFTKKVMPYTEYSSFCFPA